MLIHYKVYEVRFTDNSFNLYVVDLLPFKSYSEAADWIKTSGHKDLTYHILEYYNNTPILKVG